MIKSLTAKFTMKTCRTECNLLVSTIDVIKMILQTTATMMMTRKHELMELEKDSLRLCPKPLKGYEVLFDVTVVLLCIVVLPFMMDLMLICTSFEISCLMKSIRNDKN